MSGPCLIDCILTDASSIGLPWALRTTGIISFAANLSATMLLRDRNATVRPTQHGFALYLLKRKDVWLLLSYSFTNLFGYMTVLYSLSNFAVDLGLSQQQASIITALLNLMTFVGRPLLGLTSDRLGKIPVTACSALVMGLSCFVIWLPCNSYGVLIFYALFTGGIVGTFWVVCCPRIHFYDFR